MALAATRRVPRQATEIARRQVRLLGLVGTLGYVSLVLGLDVARSQGWLSRAARVFLRELHLVVSPTGFDWFKFVAWLVVPWMLMTLAGQRVACSFAGTRRDWLGLGVVFVGSCAAMLAIAGTSELGATYLSAADSGGGARWSEAQRRLIWTLSWLPGYEFMLRRALLERAAVFGRGSVLLVAAVEFAYHLQKPRLEAVAMFFFSMGLSLWALRRPGSLLPSLGHLCVELVLITFVALYPG